MAELLYSLQKVFTTYPKGKIYNIPEYQRGYKWSEQQVNQLLDDIYKFSLTRDNDHFYCLQNITLFQNLKNESYLNVVDGQQRLTTVTLLLSYLKANNIVEGMINYAVREPSNDFIQKVIANESNIIKTILEAEDFKTFIISQVDYDVDYQDIYHMFIALKTIDSWFSNPNRTLDIDNYKDIVLNHVKLIVNKVEQVSEQELFMNLNAGKVHLDGSDLVRAILITRVAKQELEDFDAENVEDILKLNQRRTRIGWELDEMNSWWSREDVKLYFQNFTKIKTGTKETIKFNQEEHPINLLYKIWVEIKGESDITLHSFEKEEALVMYQSLLKLNRVLQDWFEDRKIYHFLGFLFAHSKIKIKEVYDKWISKNKTRSQFINEWCLEQLKNAVFGKENPEKEESGYDYWMSKIKDYNSENATNWYDTGIIQQILIVLDIMEHSKTKEKGNPLPFLKPRYFKNYKEDKEHIFSGTPRELNEIKALPNPIEKLNEYIDSLNIDYDLLKHIPYFEYDQKQWDAITEEEQSQALNEFKSTIHKKRPVNSLGNLVLLHLTINRGFGNSQYALKRTNVITNTINGLYVRQHTLNTFIKSTSSNDLNNWTLKDIEENAVGIHTTLEEFFKPISNE
ncbi:DUF262 domain-containing protein [Polaribacter glomeratus]|uniref:GmrSD restriction endonucleases N-terminal domain-containing protein n=1 Tax=Polaribacter glomeratus TaxID=102 RepID=A0A2S7WV44_9FLAO|nr:DUF262 domain-containing protein [Polaribacter glomeratus]PQJ81484.1 hypothetical protein BTO16_02350 [Polaribacter glomeratus]TXD64688.1 DUF262 domain-containing protein [Polaribacter glomeratus]